MNPIDQLKSVLCDPEGKCCIAGSDEDRAIVDRALEALAQQEHPEQMARLGWQYVECPACGSEGARAFPKPGEPTVKQSLTVEQEPVAWLVTGENINSIQVASIQRVIDRLKHAHHADLCLRINGQDERFEADWIKHLQRATTPPQRQPLTDAEIWQMVNDCSFNRDLHADKFARAIEAAHGIGDKT